MVRAASVVGASTLLSRVAGLVRDQVAAYFFGTSAAAAAFVVAFRLPNLFRRLLAEGALTVAFVPVFTQTMQEGGRPAAGELFKSVFTLLTLVLAGLCLLGIVFAPEVVSVMAPGFRDEPDKFRLTVFLTRVLFPYISFMALGALFMGALNARGYFALPALGPFICNLATIALTFLLVSRVAPPILSLALGTMVGGFLQLAIQLPGLRRAGLPLRFSFRFRTPGVGKIFLLMGPAALGAAAYQLSIFVNTILGSFLPPGSIPWLYFADRLVQFPLGVFSMAIGTAALPALARQSASGDQEGFIDSARFALGLSFFITLPAMVGLTALALPLVTGLFQRGEFTAASSLGTAAALQAYTLGLPFLSGASILARVFYSRADTRTPTMVAAGSLGLGVVFALILMWPFQHVGLALSSSLASLVNFCWLYALLLAREKAFPQKAMLREMLICFVIAGLMGAAVWPLGTWAMAAGSLWALTGRTLVAVGAGVAVYVVLAVLTRRPQMRPAVNLLKRRLGRRK